MQSPAQHRSLHRHWPVWTSLSHLSAQCWHHPGWQLTQLSATLIRLEQLLNNKKKTCSEINQKSLKIRRGQAYGFYCFPVSLEEGNIFGQRECRKQLGGKKIDRSSVLKLVWQRAVTQRPICWGTLDINVGLSLTSCFDGQSAPWTETRSPRLDLRGPIPPHKPRENTGNAHKLPQALLSRMRLKHGKNYTRLVWQQRLVRGVQLES